MRTYDGGEDDEKDSDDYPPHAEQEANESHASSLPPGQPYTGPKRGGDLDDKDDDSLGRPALLSEPDCHAERYIDGEEGACEQLGAVPVVVVQRPEGKKGPGFVVQFARARQGKAQHQESGN